MSIELRYCKTLDQYYIQIQGEEYDQIDKKMCRLNRTIQTLSRLDRREELARLRAKYQCLMGQRRAAVRYVQAAREDLPEGVRARPIKELKGALLTVTPQRYWALLNSLRKGGKPLETSPVPGAAGGGAGAAAGGRSQCAG